MKIGVIGAGAWGTALAKVASGRGHDVTLWARERAVVEAIGAAGENTPFLPGVALDPRVRATDEIAEAAGAPLLLLAVPAQHLRSVARSLAPHPPPETSLAICAKGIELGSLMLMSEVAAAELPGRRLAVISGPTFAREVANGLPTAVTVAAADRSVGQTIVDALGGGTFRPYLSDDVVGAEIGGAVKNVIAIACGIVEGRALGDNARAALITRGLAEIIRLGRAKGARAETMMGLSGLGDLTLTCNAAQSRNFSVGVAVGKGASLAAATAGKSSIAEGVLTSLAVEALAVRLGIEMPIAAAVAAILHRGADIGRSIDALLGRRYRVETE